MDASRTSSTLDVGTATPCRYFLPEIICGRGALAEVGRTARRLGARRVLVLTEPAVVAAGWTAELQHHLAEAGVQHVLRTTVAPGPQERDVRAAVHAYHEHGCDVVVGAGGRRALNAATAAAVLATGDGAVADYEGYDRVTQPTPPLVMVPTTVGSGAGVLPSCTVRDARRRRVTMLGCALVADATLVDSRTVATLAPDLVAAAGFDALAMALAGYLSPTAGAMTDPHALAALRLLGDHLVPVVDTPDDEEEAAALAVAGVHAGVAYTATLHSGTVALAEAVAELVDVPRGTVTGVLLPHAVRRFAAARGDRYRVVADAVGLDSSGGSDAWAAHAVGDWARALADKAGIPASLSDLGVRVDVAARAVLDALGDTGAGSAAHARRLDDAMALVHAAL